MQEQRRKLDDVTVGFVISHPFHFYIYRPLIRALAKPLAIIETRKGTPFTFSKEFLAELGCEFVIVDESKLGKTDQSVDVVFVMTPKHLSAKFTNAKVVLMQYGMAKEFYNYGLWRCRADANFMYGPYSAAICQNYAVTFPVGNTRFDGFAPRATGGGGLLYMPTYGDVSSLRAFAEALPDMPQDLSIKLKLHHASEFSDAKVIVKLAEDPRITLIDAYTDVLEDIAAADVVLTDYSGAIFDAIYMEKPLVLFQPEVTQNVTRVTESSIEIQRGEELGHVLKSREELLDFLQAFTDGSMSSYPVKADRAEFFSNIGAATPTALALLEKLINDEIARSVTQESAYETYMKLISRPQVIGFKTAFKMRIMGYMRRAVGVLRRWKLV